MLIVLISASNRHLANTHLTCFNESERGNSLAVQWLGLGTFTARAWARSLMGELRSCKPRGAAGGRMNQWFGGNNSKCKTDSTFWKMPHILRKITIEREDFHWSERLNLGDARLQRNWDLDHEQL